MKTTVEIDDELLKAAKKAAIDEGVTLRELLEDGLRHRLALHRANERVRGWGTAGNASREDLYASDAWKLLDDLERAAERMSRKGAAT
ncbi:MAG: DUF2191 domain-containing protein [Dehalococcoidia bacterium]|nr:DUF2191 domain-containing protein [Dehalococcoidia bacterium]